MKFRNIILLEKDANKKGDLFGRLMSDLFHVFGYDEPRLNIHKSGREVDLNAFHRTEKKIAIAECKAHADTIGGADINKFVGVIDAERKKIKKNIANKGFSLIGYFISLSGFKETAIEQENELDNTRLILIRPEKIVEELVRGRIIVSIETAILSLSTIANGLTLVIDVDLIAYNKGWVWVIYFSNNHGQTPTHFALVHAEGKFLIGDLVEEILSIDSTLNSIFKDLILLNEVKKVTNIENENIENAKNKYFKYLENELGEIQFEGLPTDKEAGSVKVKLENIFVPLHFMYSAERKKKGELNLEKPTRQNIGQILNKTSKLAILAKPGGGKSTLIKRIAIAYAFPERRKLIDDELPEKAWFPIFLRCRELGDKVVLGITEIIENIPNRAEINYCSDYFAILVSRALQNGNALILIDGLDEIADEKNRIIFVRQLRTFIATYPSINIIVTSREAGFRSVAGSLASYCHNLTVSSLTHNEIIELSLKWHKAIIDDSENTIIEANKLSELILKDSRIKILAENPLLLTTLLFVRRWAGYLPTKRNVLYQEMIKLLLVTWNVEGHEILEIEEAEPQLAFIAYWMTKNGHQTITVDELHECLIDARKQMPEILGYTRVSPTEFIKRVESRSSLLIMSGHKRLDSGTISPMYEFLHLSFQEYLTAKAIVKKFIPKNDYDRSPLENIILNVKNENWKEVIPLVAVLLERDAKQLIEYLIKESRIVSVKGKGNTSKEEKLIPSLLGNCLANEVQIGPEILEIAIEWYIKNIYTILDSNSLNVILNSKFGETLRRVSKRIFFDKFDDEYASEAGSTIGNLFVEDFGQDNLILENIYKFLKGTDEEKCIASLGLMIFSFSNNTEIKTMERNKVLIDDIFSLMLKVLEEFKESDKYYKHFTFSVSWSLAWAGSNRILPEKFNNPYSKILIKLWIGVKEHHYKRVLGWALSFLLDPTLDLKDLKLTNISETIHNNINSPITEYDKLISGYLSIIVGDVLKNEEILPLIRNSKNINNKFRKQLAFKIKNDRSKLNEFNMKVKK